MTPDQEKHLNRVIRFFGWGVILSLVILIVGLLVIRSHDVAEIKAEIKTNALKLDQIDRRINEHFALEEAGWRKP